MGITKPFKSGFTLIELLIVVAIIAILAAIAVPNFLEAQTRSKVSRVKTDLRTLATAMESYKIDNNKYIPVTNKAPEKRSDRFIRLSTPISYLNGIIYDVFAPSAQLETDILVIWGAPAWGDSLALPKSYFLEQKGHHGAMDDYKSFWVGFSMGPDKDYDVNDPGRPTVGIQSYDPTNGSISDGDILRSIAGDMSN